MKSYLIGAGCFHPSDVDAILRVNAISVVIFGIAPCLCVWMAKRMDWLTFVSLSTWFVKLIVAVLHSLGFSRWISSGASAHETSIHLDRHMKDWAMVSSGEIHKFSGDWTRSAAHWIDMKKESGLRTSSAQHSEQIKADMKKQLLNLVADVVPNDVLDQSFELGSEDLVINLEGGLDKDAVTRSFLQAVEATCSKRSHLLRVMHEQQQFAVARMIPLKYGSFVMIAFGTEFDMVAWVLACVRWWRLDMMILRAVIVASAVTFGGMMAIVTWQSRCIPLAEFVSPVQLRDDCAGSPLFSKVFDADVMIYLSLLKVYALKKVNTMKTEQLWRSNAASQP